MFRTPFFSQVFPVFARPGKQPLSESSSNIFRAAATGDLLRVERLLARDMDELAARDGMGSTPIHLAVANGQTAMVSLLLAYGADPNAQDPMGMTPLHLAAKRGDENLAYLLIGAGARSDVITAQGVTPSMMAGTHGYRKLADYMLACN